MKSSRYGCSKEGGTLRQMSTEKLIKTLPTLQNQIDALLDFDVTTNDLNNGVINAAFMLLFRDLIRLFACYNDGIINLLEKYFDMNKKNARDALDLYKKFLIRMDRVADFLKVAEVKKPKIRNLKLTLTLPLSFNATNRNSESIRATFQILPGYVFKALFFLFLL